MDTQNIIDALMIVLPFVVFVLACISLNNGIQNAKRIKKYKEEIEKNCETIDEFMKVYMDMNDEEQEQFAKDVEKKIQDIRRMISK